MIFFLFNVDNYSYTHLALRVFKKVKQLFPILHVHYFYVTCNSMFQAILSHISTPDVGLGKEISADLLVKILY